MATIDDVKSILGNVLQLGTPRTDKLARDTQLLGGIPELDSMAVLSVIAALEENFGITVEDDEVTTTNFETVGSLTDFVARKLAA
jgi:acyl carrier protein